GEKGRPGGFRVSNVSGGAHAPGRGRFIRKETPAYRGKKVLPGSFRARKRAAFRRKPCKRKRRGARVPGRLIVKVYFDRQQISVISGFVVDFFGVIEYNIVRENYQCAIGRTI
ncbi:MAG: hypothetical protein ACI4L8_08140, partial [Candidatus Fimadaptatus sp.]